MKGFLLSPKEASILIATMCAWVKVFILSYSSFLYFVVFLWIHCFPYVLKCMCHKVFFYHGIFPMVLKCISDSRRPTKFVFTKVLMLTWIFGNLKIFFWDVIIWLILKWKWNIVGAEQCRCFSTRLCVHCVDTEKGVNQYQVQFKTFFNLYLNHSTISNEQWTIV
jgi:hypothetical protein